jgi:hypothetical protein
MAEFRPVNLAEIYGQIDAARANQANMENNRMMQERQRRQFAMEDEQLAEQRALKDVYGRSIDNVDGTPQLNEKRLLSEMIRINPAKAMELQDSFSKRDSEKQKLQIETQKAELAKRVETSKYLRDLMPSITDQASHDAFRQEAEAVGATGILQSMPAEFNPKWVESNMYTSGDFIKKAEAELNRGVQMRGQDITMRGQDLSRDTTIRGQDISASTARRGQDITARGQDLSRDTALRGQNLTDARAKEAQNKKIAPNEKLTEGMRSTGQYAARMKAAEDLLGLTTEQAPGIGEKVMGALGETSANIARSPDRQKSLQAQRDWVRAKLRKESGAAIGVDEMNNEILTYFPQIGDSQDVIDQKKIARDQAVTGMIESSGGAYTAPKPPPAKPKDKKQKVFIEADKILGL